MDSISASFLLVFILPIVLYVLTSNLHYLALFIAVFLFGGMIEFIKLLLGTDGKYARPSSACQCDLLCVSVDDGGKPGYPSGHMAISTFFIGTLSVLLMNQGSPYVGYSVFLMGLVWIYHIGQSRLQKQCHTLEQVVAGFLAGIVGAVSYVWTLYVLHLI
jgi:hypothetical protein